MLWLEWSLEEIPESTCERLERLGKMPINLFTWGILKSTHTNFKNTMRKTHHAIEEISPMTINVCCWKFALSFTTLAQPGCVLYPLTCFLLKMTCTHTHHSLQLLGEETGCWESDMWALVTSFARVTGVYAVLILLLALWVSMLSQEKAEP